MRNRLFTAPSRFSYSSSDTDGVAQVEFFIDGNSVGDGSQNGNVWTLSSWNSASVSEGDHTLSATATDNLGAMRSDSIIVTVDNTDELPSVALTNPSEGESVSGNVTLSADVSADAGSTIANVEFFVGATSLGGVNYGNNVWWGCPGRC